MKEQSKIKEIFETISGLFLVVLYFAIGIGILIAFTKGATFLTETMLQIMTNISLVALILILLVILPVSIIKGARGVVSVILMLGSYIFGITAWLIGFALTYTYWGITWVVVGVFLAGIGVAPFGLLASAFKADWSNFFILVLALVMTYGLRFYSIWLSEKYEEYKYNKNLPENEIIEGELSEEDNLTLCDGSLINKSNISIGDDSSILLVGQSGTGKTELVKSLIKNLKNDYSPDEVKFVLFDLKCVEFIDEDEKYLLKDIITDAPKGVIVLRQLVEEAKKRIENKHKFPAIVIYIEECDIAAQFQDKFDTLMISLLGKAKKANYCVIYSTSRVDSGTISYNLLKHFEIILASRLYPGQIDYLGIGDTSDIKSYNFMRFDNGLIERKERAVNNKPTETKRKEIESRIAKKNKPIHDSDELEDWDNIK